jgi:hypothetical protein
LEKQVPESREVLQPVINRIVPVAFERGLDALSQPERNVFLVWGYPVAVNDGGHASFFYNSFGEHAHQTVAALEKVGAPALAALLRQAIDLFPGGQIPRDIDERNDALDALPDEAGEVMERLDEEFFGLGSEKLCRGSLPTGSRLRKRSIPFESYRRVQRRRVPRNAGTLWFNTFAGKQWG